MRREHKTHVAGKYLLRFCTDCSGQIMPGQKYRKSGRKYFHVSPDCPEAKVSSPSEPLPQPSIEEFERSRTESSTWRCVWTREYIAKEIYVCDSCKYSYSTRRHALWDIYEGERYRREVWVNGNSMVVRRSHIHCPDDDDPYEDERWDEDDVHGEVIEVDFSQSRTPLRKAA